MTAAHDTFDAPENFVPEKTMAAWRSKGPGGANIMLVREVVEACDLRRLASYAIDNVAEKFSDANVDASVIEFTDGVRGALLEYTHVVEDRPVSHLQALRLDGDVLTTATFAAKPETYARELYLASVRSLSIC